MLVTGAGESGKTTILKQLKVLHNGDAAFSKEQLQEYRSRLHWAIRLCILFG